MNVNNSPSFGMAFHVDSSIQKLRPHEIQGLNRALKLPKYKELAKNYDISYFAEKLDKNCRDYFLGCTVSEVLPKKTINSSIKEFFEVPIVVKQFAFTDPVNSRRLTDDTVKLYEKTVAENNNSTFKVYEYLVDGVN